LEQVNNEREPQWKIWEQSEDCESRGRRAFQAAEAAQRQGKAAFDRFHMSLLRARHEQERDIADMNTLLAVADRANLDMMRFQKNLAESRRLHKLAEDHIFAVENLGIFGTPTLVFSQRQAVFVKLSVPPPPEECLSAFMEIYHLASKRQYIQEIKRPQRR